MDMSSAMIFIPLAYIAVCLFLLIFGAVLLRKKRLAGKVVLWIGLALTAFSAVAIYPNLMGKPLPSIVLPTFVVVALLVTLVPTNS